MRVSDRWTLAQSLKLLPRMSSVVSVSLLLLSMAWPEFSAPTLPTTTWIFCLRFAQESNFWMIDFWWYFFLYCSATRPTSNGGPGVRYFRGEVLPAMSDSPVRFLFSFMPVFSVELKFENVTVLCFDFCDYETFVLLFQLFFTFCVVCVV